MCYFYFCMNSYSSYYFRATIIILYSTISGNPTVEIIADLGFITAQILLIRIIQLNRETKMFGFAFNTESTYYTC